MAIGYMIRMGDRTSCGGQVLDGYDGFKIMGMPQAREGDPVSCGVTGQVHRIEGGVHHFTNHGSRVAGNLDSLSSCPCRARLLHSTTMFSYVSANKPTTARNSQPAANASSGEVSSSSSQGFTPTSATPRTDSDVAEPGFHIVPHSMSRSALEAALFDTPSLQTLAMFRALNPGQGNFKGGSMVILSDPRNLVCTREEALLMEAAAIVNEALAPLSDEEADFMVRYYGEISTFLAHSAAAIGVGEAMFSRNLDNVKRNMVDVQDLFMKSFDREGKLNSTQFQADRARIFTSLDNNLSPLTRRAIGFPDHPKLKTALGLSTRSLVHHWSKAGKAGPIPGYAAHIERVSKTAKILKAGGWVGTAIGGGASYLKVQKVCSEGNPEACEKVKFTETGSFFGGLGGGAAGGFSAGLGAGFVCAAIGIGTAGVGGIVCGIVLVGAGSVAGGAVGSLLGEELGEIIYEQAR